MSVGPLQVERQHRGQYTQSTTMSICSLVMLCKEACILPHGPTHSASALLYVYCTWHGAPAGFAAEPELCPSQTQAAACCLSSQAWPNRLQEAESDAAASQVQVATMQRQLTAARCTSLLELRQQVLGGAGAGTSAPEMSSGEFSFRPSGTANEVWWLIAKRKLCAPLQGRASSRTFSVPLPHYNSTLGSSPNPPLLCRFTETDSWC